MKSIGEVLAESRQKRGWSQQRLAQETTVPVEFIKQLEKQDYHQLPARSLVQGYIQLMANALRIPEDTALALFRRDFPLDSTVKPTVRRSSALSRWGSSTLWWQPKIISVAGVLVLLLLIASILLIQWQKLGQPPQLKVTSLENHSLITSPVNVTGQTDPGATVTINTEIVSLDQQGNFSYEMELPSGERSIVIQARDARGNLTEEVYFVTVE